LAVRTTLNGSGLAVGRTFAAIVENYQRSDGMFKIRKFFDFLIWVEITEHQKIKIITDFLSRRNLIT